jgi:hypothetical protein
MIWIGNCTDVETSARNRFIVRGSMALLSRSFIRKLLVSLGTIASIATAAWIAATGTASADPQNVGGWTAGIALGAPLPEGIYFVDIALFNELCVPKTQIRA